MFARYMQHNFFFSYNFMSCCLSCQKTSPTSLRVSKHFAMRGTKRILSGTTRSGKAYKPQSVRAAKRRALFRKKSMLIRIRLKPTAKSWPRSTKPATTSIYRVLPSDGPTMTLKKTKVSRTSTDVTPMISSNRLSVQSPIHGTPPEFRTCGALYPVEPCPLRSIAPGLSGIPLLTALLKPKPLRRPQPTLVPWTCQKANCPICTIDRIGLDC